MPLSRRSFLQGSLGSVTVGAFATELGSVPVAMAADTHAGAAHMQILRSRLLFLNGITEDRTPDVLKLVEERDSAIDSTLKGQLLDKSAPSYGSFWGDKGVLTLSTYSGMWYMEVHKILARGFADQRSRHYKSRALIQAIEASLKWIAPVLREDPKHRTGFYFWDIYNHSEAAHTLVLCGDGLSKESRSILTNFLETLPSQVFQVNRKQGVLKPLESGSNMLDVLYAMLLRGVGLNDPQWIKSAVAQLPIAMGKAPGGEGIQNDWSYHFHGRGINLGYGMNDIAMRARWFFLTHDTSWQIKPELQVEYLGLIREFFRFNFWKGRVSPYVIDRGIAVPGGIFADHKMREVFALSLLAGFSPKDREMLAATASHTAPKASTDLYQSALQSRTDSIIEKADQVYLTIRFYPESDYLIARQKAWFAAIRMASIRTKAWDTQNRMHVRGSSSGEFSVALMTDGNEFDNATIPTMKWNRLMGVTRSDTIEAPPMSYGQSTFVGGLSEENALGVAAMQYLLAPPGQDTLTGNKSVFVSPVSIVLLGNRIRCNSDEPVVTTLFHAPLQSDATYLCNNQKLDSAVDGRWELKTGDVLTLRNVCIRLLHPATLFFELREGTYAGLNDPQNPEAKKESWQKRYAVRWAYLETHHGKRPVGGAYGAELWPSVDTDFSPPKSNVFQSDAHHRIDLPGGRGAEVRFPIDWRENGGLSYSGAEPFKWGSIAQWMPGFNNDDYQLQLVSPRRYAPVPSSSTELQLPDGFTIPDRTLTAMTGKPFPSHLVSAGADGKVRTMTVLKK